MTFIKNVSEKHDNVHFSDLLTADQFEVLQGVMEESAVVICQTKSCRRQLQLLNEESSSLWLFIDSCPVQHKIRSRFAYSVLEKAQLLPESFIKTKMVCFVALNTVAFTIS